MKIKSHLLQIKLDENTHNTCFKVEITTTNNAHSTQYIHGY